MVRRYATLRRSEITRGKSAGEHTIEAAIDGEVVGQLTALMGKRYLPLLRDDIPMCCEALIAQGEKRYEVTLHLPSMVT